MLRRLVLLTCLSALISQSAGISLAAEPGLLEPSEFVIEDFESDDALERWRFDRDQAGADGRCVATLSTEWVSHGARSARVVFRAGDGWPNMQSINDEFDEWPNFAEFEYLRVDLKNPASHPAPMPRDSSHGLIFFTSQGLRPNSINANLDAGQVLHLEVDIPRQLGDRQGQPVDTALINAFHFYAWNPSVEYVRYIDHIRLTRNLGLHFSQISEALDLLGGVGLPADDLTALRTQAESERERLARLPFSLGNMAQARRAIADLERETASREVFIPRFRERVLAILRERQWGAGTAAASAELTGELMRARLALDQASPGNNPYARRVLERLEAELRLVGADVANAGRLLPRATPARDFVVGWTHGSSFVKPYGQVLAGGFDRAVVSGARGEIVGVQVVVSALDEDVPGVKLHLQGLPDWLAAGNVRAYALGFMNLGTAPEGSPAYRLQWYPDILYPAPEGGISVPAMTPQPYLIEIEIPRTAPAGWYDIAVEIASERGKDVLPVSLRVYDFEVPERFSLKTTSGVRFADAPVLARYGLDPGNIYGGWIGQSDEFILSQYRLGQQLFNIDNQKNGWTAYSRKGWAFDPARGTEEQNWERYIGKYSEFLARMDKLGIPRQAFFFYGFDEVPPDPEIPRFLERLRTLGVPVMGTPMGSGWLDEPAGTFDMWAGGLGSGETRRKRIAQVHEARGQTWWYDNNLGFDPDVWVARQKGWYARHWDMDGYLIYSAHAWTARDEKHLDRATLPYSDWREPSRDARGAACALTYNWGDSAEERYPAFRLWNFRAGLYDHEYLVLLETLVDAVNRSGARSADLSLLRRARQLTRVPESLVPVTTLDAAAGTALDLPNAVANRSSAADLIAARDEAARLIMALKRLQEPGER